VAAAVEVGLGDEIGGDRGGEEEKEGDDQLVDRRLPSMSRK
jgi:hypothetical protein